MKHISATVAAIIRSLAAWREIKTAALVNNRRHQRRREIDVNSEH